MHLPENITQFMEIFRSAHFTIFVVGGPVRDMLLGKTVSEIQNWDFATNATPDEILKLIPTAKYENDFGTVLVPIEDGLLCEVTPFRKEGTYSDSRHPDSIEWAQTIEEDLARRDFTINAIAYDGTHLIDTTGGKEDLAAHLVKAVGDPHKRFAEDALRLLRAVRFATQLNFSIDSQTRAAIQELAPTLKNISQERIRDEFLKILSSDRPAEGVELLRSTGLLIYILPELEQAFGVEQASPGRHHTTDVGTHLLAALRHTPSTDPITRLAVLLHDIGKPATRAVDEKGITTFYNHEIVGANMAHEIATRLRLSKKDTIKLTKLVRYHMFSVGESQTDSAVRRFLRKIGLELVDDMLALRTGDRLGSGAPESSWRTELFKKRIEEVQHVPFSIHALAISGHDIMTELGLEPGPHIGEILKDVFAKVDTEELSNDREALLEYVKSKKI